MRRRLLFLLLLSASPEAADACGIYTARDARVFYEVGTQQTPVLLADAATFVPYFTSSEDLAPGCVGAADFGRDKSAVFFRDKKIEGVDYTSFTIVKGIYAKDKQTVYMGGEVLRGANPEHFSIRDEENLLSQDASYFFCGAYAFPKNKTSPYADGFIKDDQNLCRRGKVIEGFHVATFVYLGRGYALDETGVFYNADINAAEQVWKPLEGADRSSFDLIKPADKYHSIHCPYAVDTQSVYFTDAYLAESVDKASFACIPCPQGQGAPACAQDKDAFYVGAERLPLQPKDDVPKDEPVQ